MSAVPMHIPFAEKWERDLVKVDTLENGKQIHFEQKGELGGKWRIVN